MLDKFLLLLGELGDACIFIFAVNLVIVFQFLDILSYFKFTDGQQLSVVRGQKGSPATADTIEDGKFFLRVFTYPAETKDCCLDSGFHIAGQIFAPYERIFGDIRAGPYYLDILHQIRIGFSKTGNGLGVVGGEINLSGSHCHAV